MSKDSRIQEKLEQAISGLDLAPDEAIVADAASFGRPGPRRSSFRKAAATMTNLEVVEFDGALSLQEQPLIALPSKRRAMPLPAHRLGEVKAATPMAILPYNKVSEQIDKLDRKLNSQRGLGQWVNGKIVRTSDIRPLSNGKKILLFVHGTFSKSEAFFDQIDRSGFTEGKAFLKAASSHYDQILTFDHPTLSVSPFVNAHQLSMLMQGTPAAVDVVCHSRGGVVTRWWLEAMDHGGGQRRAVFVGVPLEGTGLASPANIRQAMDMCYNIGNVLTKASMAVPFLQFATGAFQIVTSVLRVAGKTPLADAVIALIPGLAGQSRVGNNYEMLSLRQQVSAAAKTHYFGVTANFETEKNGWQFWKNFRKGALGNKVKDIGADFLFEGDNDLVVDTSSMSNFTDQFMLPNSNILAYGTQSKVMHTNYFEQRETLQHIRHSFGF